MTLICTVIVLVQFVSGGLQSMLCVSSALWFPEDGCSLYSKNETAVRPIVQLFGNKRVCVCVCVCVSDSCRENVRYLVAFNTLQRTGDANLRF